MKHTFDGAAGLASFCTVCGARITLVRLLVMAADPDNPLYDCPGGTNVTAPATPDLAPQVEKQCTCGAAAVGSSFHSSWC